MDEKFWIFSVIEILLFHSDSTNVLNLSVGYGINYSVFISCEVQGKLIGRAI